MPRLQCPIYALVAAACLSMARPLSAQDSAQAPAQVEAARPGARVRVQTAGRTYTGILVSQDADSLRVEVSNDIWGPEARKWVVALPYDSVTLMQVSAGHATTHLALGAVGGGVLGAGLGAVIGSFGNLLCGLNNTCDPSRAQRGALIGGVVGVLVGMAAGSVGSERWVPVGPRSATLQITPQAPARLGVGLGFRF